MTAKLVPVVSALVVLTEHEALLEQWRLCCRSGVAAGCGDCAGGVGEAGGVCAREVCAVAGDPVGAGGLVHADPSLVQEAWLEPVALSVQEVLVWANYAKVAALEALGSMQEALIQ